MNAEKKKNETFHIIPNNDKKCVWMDSGIITYKICDRDFNCDACPLNQGLRGDSESLKENDEQRNDKQQSKNKS